MNVLIDSLYFGAVLTISIYLLTSFIHSKLNFALLSPMPLSMVIIILILIFFQIPYEDYFNTAQYIHYLLTPTTICLALPLYRQITYLKNNLLAIAVSILVAVFANGLCVLVVAKMFRLASTYYYTLLPNSITMAVGIPLSEEIGGIGNLTVASIAVSGIFGSIVAERILKTFGIINSVAKGLAIGSSCHAIGTAKAVEIGEVEAAMSGLAIAVTGLMTVVFIQVFIALG